MLVWLLGMLTVVSWIYWLVASWLAREFFREPAAENLDFTPAVSILKPVKGVDPGAYENFASFCRQDYPQYEMIFGVADPTDPVIPVIERLMREFPERPIRLSVAEPRGANRKAGLLHHLAGQAAHDILVLSDSDIRVGPDYLRRVVAPLSDPKVGAVTCPYHGAEALTVAAGLEALHMGATFLPSVIVARRLLRMRFALGAGVALRRSDLARIGGFAALAEYLADDYQLGARLSDLGLRIQLSDYVLDIVLGAVTLREQWRREVRWARCNRVSRPREYPGLLLSFSTPLAAAWSLLSGEWRVLAASVLIRWAIAWRLTGYTGDRATRAWLPWLPVCDFLEAAVWFAGGIGRRVIWRGEEFLLAGDGRMRPLSRVAECLEAGQNATRVS
ncbi:MAG: bacteriohopanetetrol glucosamine biosynthesis glycosyltransferase HpnI [Bacteroidota bacterium]